MITGTGVSGGIGIGRIRIVKEQKIVYERRRIRDTEKEIQRLRSAVGSFVKVTEVLPGAGVFVNINTPKDLLLSNLPLLQKEL